MMTPEAKKMSDEECPMFISIYVTRTAFTYWDVGHTLSVLLQVAPWTLIHCSEQQILS